MKYGTGVATLTGNAIRGKGTERGVGLNYSAKDGTSLVLVSSGNVVHNVHKQRVAGDRVTLSAGL